MTDRLPDYTPVAELLRPSEVEVGRLQDAAERAAILLKRSLGSMPGFITAQAIGSAATGYILRGTRDIDLVASFATFDKREFRYRVNSIVEFSDVTFSDDPRIVTDKFNCRFITMALSCGAVVGNAAPEVSLQADLLHHSEFWKRVPPPRIDDVLLCKQFFKNLELYGTHIGGFAVELLIAHFGTFQCVLQALAADCPILVDFSGRFTCNKDSIVVAYPYSGLANLVRGIGPIDEQRTREYARAILLDPWRFRVDTQRNLTRNFWMRRFLKYGGTETYGMPDIFLARREDHELRRIITRRPSRRVLDAGCGNGVSTIRINRRRSYATVGVDTHQQAIAAANRLAETCDSVSFSQGCLTALPFPQHAFDIVYAKRSLSNLPSTEDQLSALSECARVLRPGGMLILQDLFREGFEHLNRLRLRWRLPLLDVPYHIIPLEHDMILSFCSNRFATVQCVDYTSTYYFLTRIVFARIAKWLRLPLWSTSPLHRLAAWLPSSGRLGVNCLYVCENRRDD